MICWGRVLLLNRRDRRIHKFFCYARHSFVDIKDKGCLEEELTKSHNISRQQVEGSKGFEKKLRTKGLEGHEGFTKVGAQRPC